MHVCQDELLVVAWAIEHLRLGWAYAIHVWHWAWRRRQARG